jgi:4-hydroxy-tetrahydrodipicolinate reductase
MASWTIPAGHVAGVAASWQGRIGDRTLVELSVRWKKGTTLEPDWVIEKDGWVIRVDGLPTVTASLDFLPPPDFEGETIEDFMSIGHIITAVPALNAVPAVVAAPPGIVTYADLSFPMPRGWVR